MKLCPVCARTRAARSVRRWQAVLEAAAASGATIRHLTLTQRSEATPGGLVTDRERRKGWTGQLARDGELGRPVAGEGLLAAYYRFRDAFRAIRMGSGTRALWKAGLGGYLVGLEWTGRAPGGVPRWHVHAHVMTTHAPGAPIPPADELLGSWARHVGGSVRAQRWTDVDAGAVREVLKYPFKPGHLTSAQRIEVLAVARGLHSHHLGGGWHSRGKLGAPEPYRTWLQARPPDPDCRLLHILQPDGWARYTGQVRRGEHMWSHHSDGRDPFEAPAAKFAAVLEPTYAEPGADAWLDDQTDLLAA